MLGTLGVIFWSKIHIFWSLCLLFSHILQNTAYLRFLASWFFDTFWITTTMFRVDMLKQLYTHNVLSYSLHFKIENASKSIVPFFRWVIMWKRGWECIYLKFCWMVIISLCYTKCACSLFLGDVRSRCDGLVWSGVSSFWRKRAGFSLVFLFNISFEARLRCSVGRRRM